MNKTMKLQGINDTCKNDSVKNALKLSGYVLRVKKVSWPRMRGVAGVRIDCGTGNAVAFVRS